MITNGQTNGRTNKRTLVLLEAADHRSQLKNLTCQLQENKSLVSTNNYSETTEGLIFKHFSQKTQQVYDQVGPSWFWPSQNNFKKHFCYQFIGLFSLHFTDNCQKIT